MAKFTQDANIPSHGRRAKADNAGTVRVHISRREGMCYIMGDNDFDFFLNVIPEERKYHATAENESGFPPKKKAISVDIPSDVIDKMLALAQDKGFMSIKNDEIFPDMMMLDGDDIKITVKSDIGSISLDSNMLADTLINGIIPVADKEYSTPIHELTAIACETLDIKLDSYEEEDDEEDRL